MTTDEFYAGLADLIYAKTGIRAIWSDQQARNPNAGKPIPPGASAASVRKYILLAPGQQTVHSLHKIKDPTDLQGVKTIDMLPIEVRFTVSGIECRADELRPVWSLFMRDDFKTSLSEDWSILSVGEIGYSPIYEKGEWKQRYLFESRALIYDRFVDPNQFPILSTTITYGVWNPSHTAIAYEGTLSAEAGS